MESKCGYNSRLPRVAVLLSSYNGEKYIKEQIDSILNQTYGNLTLYVRDDGSADCTLSILSAYEKRGEIVLFRGKNKGYINSFFELMKQCEAAEYYAWCDQDDIWMPEKIERAVDKLEEDRNQYLGTAKNNSPVLYFSDYDYYDETMCFQKHGLIHKRGPSFANSLMDCISLGFNSVFNHRAREMMCEKTPEHCCGHDWWTYMICAAFGRVIYDRGFISVKYRRIEKSISPGGKNFLALQIWRFKKFFLNDYFMKIREQLWEFADLYFAELSNENAKIMRLFAKKKYHLTLALKKMFYPVRFRQGVVEEGMVRLLFLIGKL